MYIKLVSHYKLSLLEVLLLLFIESIKIVDIMNINPIISIHENATLSHKIDIIVAETGSIQAYKLALVGPTYFTPSR